MSQKTAKRARRHTEEEVEISFKVPVGSKGKEDNGKSEGKPKEDAETNGNELNGVKDEAGPTNGDNEHADSSKRVIQTRSRTPQVKAEESKETKDGDKEEEEKEEKKQDASTESAINGGESEQPEESSASLPSSPEMEPLVLEKEEEEAAIPELQYDENELDLESEGSPNRCKTRRSDARVVSTPKTPRESETDKTCLERLNDENVSGKSTPKKPTSSTVSNVDSESQPDDMPDLDNLDTSDTFSSVSTDNLSTRAVTGSDATRNIDFTYQDSGLFDENSLSSVTSPNPNRTLAETLRNLSSRRAIRPLNSDYRKLAMQNTLDAKRDYPDYESVQRIAGVKRKDRSITPDESKRFKRDGSGLFSYFSRPFTGFSRQSSTPKLVAYEYKKEFEEENPKINVEVGGDPSKKWCSIM